MTFRALVDEAAKLTPTERWELVDELLRIAHDEQAGVELTAPQAADLDRRAEELRSGEATLIPGDKAIEMLKRRQ